MRGEDGQATVELVALLPLLLVIAFAAAALLASHMAGEQAGQAAEAGAVALLQGGDPREAARRALPTSARRDAEIEVQDRRVTVRVRPKLPLAVLERPLTGEAVADSGPEVAP
jgi:Flp pilus assembly protein TadG